MSSRLFSRRRAPESEECIDIEVEEDDDRAVEITIEPGYYYDRKEPTPARSIEFRGASSYSKYGQQAHLSNKAEPERQRPSPDNYDDKYGQQLYPRSMSAPPKHQHQRGTPGPSRHEGHSRFDTASSRNRAQSRGETDALLAPAPQEYCRRSRLASESQERVHQRNIGGYYDWLSRREQIKRRSETQPLGEPIVEHLNSTKYQAVDERFNRFHPYESVPLSRGAFEGIVDWVNGKTYHPWQDRSCQSRNPRPY